MYIFKKNNDLNAYLTHLQKEGLSIGFVPTMGALHMGHLTLLKSAARQCDVTVCSIFVNPTQFNDNQDYEKYPVRTEEDIQKLLQTNADILFLPTKEEIYPHGTDKLPVYDFGRLETIWEGAFRPGHFQGVGQVMQCLLEIVHPDVLFMGQKDYQQLLIINELIELLAINVKMEIHPTLREPDGLAMSSRNLRLSPEARKKAPAIYQTLLFVKENFRKIAFDELLEKAQNKLTGQGFKVDYIALANAKDLQSITHPISGSMICLVAAWLDGIRLIDNMLLDA